MAASVKALALRGALLLLACLLSLHYLSLLQPPAARRMAARGSLFTVDWPQRRADRRPLLTPLERVPAPGQQQQQQQQRQREDDEDDSPGANASDGRPVCPLIPSNLNGPIKVFTGEEVPGTMEAVAEAVKANLSPGGFFSPSKCSARHTVAIIIPYRDREEHLKTWLFNLHPLLQRQNIAYGIFIVEQFGSGPFNRAKLMNIGAKEALAHPHNVTYDCFVFHDVDLLPEDDRNLYTCPSQPRHMSVAIDTFSYRLPYDAIFGGVSALSVDHFKKVNGFSNVFWGWGGEDDDMSNRLRQNKLYISRYPANIARYKMLKHGHSKANPERFKYLYNGSKRMQKDGLNTLNYKRIDMKETQLYTWILADLKQHN